MKTVDSIEAVSFNHDNLKPFCNNNKCVRSLNGIELVFELTRDLADPTKDYIPFIFYQNVDTNKFEIFLCFMNVEHTGKYMKEMKQKE